VTTATRPSIGHLYLNARGVAIADLPLASGA
jgi:hypothetical protein